MGNEANCCRINTPGSSNKNELEAFSPKKIEMKENQQNIDHEVQGDYTGIKSLRNSSKDIRLGLDKLYDLRFNVAQFHSDYFDNTQENVVTQNMDEESYFCGGVTQSKLTDYICFKKYSPKTHYTFVNMLSNSKDHKTYMVMNKKSNIKRVIKVEKVPKDQRENIHKSSNFISVINDLDHPNLIRIFQVYNYKERKYFVMEYMQGGSLKDSHGCRLAKKISGVHSFEIYFEEIKVIAKQILYALCFLHEKNILHLNIQPKNILLSNKFGSKKIIFGKLTGFGYSLKNVTNILKKIDSHILENLKEEQQLLAPEISERSQVCLKTDIWFLGLAIFTTITKVKINRVKNYSEMKSFLTDVWKKMEQNLQISENQCFDLILKMVDSDVDKRLTALECLKQPWFNSLQVTQDFQQEFRHSSHVAFKQAINKKKLNNLMNYIESLIVYRNMTQKQTLIISQIFQQLDKDKDGTVAIEELIQYFQKQVKKDGQEHEQIFQFCLELITNIDKNNSGSIDYHEFNQGLLFLFQNKCYTKQAIQEIFDYMDVNGDGEIVIKELQDILKSCNIQELQFYMRKLDKDYDGSIRRDQFVNYCLQKFQEKTQAKKRKIAQSSKKIRKLDESIAKQLK